MEEKLAKLKSLFKVNASPSTCEPTQPQIGFKVTFLEHYKQLKVKVIGARQLPVNYGSTKPMGYLVKVTVFPQKEKFETAIVKESWPTFNEEFTFTLQSNYKYAQDYLKDKFISFTVYAVLDNVTQSATTTRNRGTLKRFFSFSEFGENTNKFRRSFRHSLNSRRTVGNATYSLEKKAFTQRIGTTAVSTPDIWRDIKEITSGIHTEPREGKKGSAEVTLSYAVSEDGRNDTVEIGVTRFRCGLQTMQEHEKIGGQLYIKITAFEHEDLIQKMKSDKFEPTISLKMEANTATLRATVNNYNIEQVKLLVRLICRNMLGKKTVLGKIEIDSKSDIWKQIVSTPSLPVTRMINFE